MASVDDETAKIVDLLYDLQFGRAIAGVRELETLYPDSPAGPFYRSVAYYQLSLVQDPPSAKTFEMFRSANQETLRKAAALAASEPALSHYYQGAALGFDARAYIAQKRYALALGRAREGVMQLKKALELDPTLEDAKLGLGLYYYFLARMPPVMKPVAYMMVGLWGDRERGLTLLSEVAEKGHAARPEAQSVLGSIFASQREQKWDDALGFLTDLADRFPHNPRYRFKIVYVLQRKGLWEKAAERADPEGLWITDLDPIVKDRAQSAARYRAAESLLFAGKMPESLLSLDRLEAENPPGIVRDWLALRWGNYWDGMGKPNKAKPYYATIRNKKARVLADQFVKTPFPSGPDDVMPNYWPPSNIPAD